MSAGRPGGWSGLEASLSAGDAAAPAPLSWLSRPDDPELRRLRRQAELERQAEERAAAAFEALMAGWPVEPDTALRCPDAGVERADDIRAEQTVRLAALDDDGFRLLVRSTERDLLLVERGDPEWARLQRGRDRLIEEARRRRLKPGFRTGRRADPAITARQRLAGAARVIWHDPRAAAVHLLDAMAGYPDDTAEVAERLRADAPRLGRLRPSVPAESYEVLAGVLLSCRRALP